jgi:hypothetical protein
VGPSAPDATGQYWLFLRMNRALPHDKRGIRATFELDGGTASFGTPVTKSRHPPCYATQISAGDNPRSPAKIVHARNGELVEVTLPFRGRDVTSASVAAKAVDRDNLGSD